MNRRHLHSLRQSPAASPIDTTYLRRPRSLAMTAVVFVLTTFHGALAVGQSGGNSIGTLLPNEHDLLATRLAVKLFPRLHVSHREIDEGVYRRTLDRLIVALDPHKLFFTDADVRGFYDDATANTKSLARGDPAFAFALVNLWIRRVSDRLHLIIDMSHRHQSRPPIGLRVNDPIRGFATSGSELYHRWTHRMMLERRLLLRGGVPADDVGRQIVNRHRQMLPNEDEAYHLDVRALLLDSLARTYDAQSAYLSEEDLCYLYPRWRRDEIGIGAFLEWQNGLLTITGVIPQGPACRDGRLKPGDRILAFSPDGSDTVVVPSQLQTVNFGLDLKGKPGTHIRLVVHRQEETDLRDYRIVLTKTDTSRLVVGMVVKGDSLHHPSQKLLGYVRLSRLFMDSDNFAETTQGNSASRELAKLLSDFDSQGVGVVLLDLRSCCNGYLSEAVKAGGLLLGNCPIAQAQLNDGPTTSYAQDDATMAWGGPLVVLTDRGTRREGEVLAAALQDYQRALLVGEENTFGDGAIRSLFGLASSSGAKEHQMLKLGSVCLAYATIYRPNGQAIHHGVRPHVVIPVGDSLAPAELPVVRPDHVSSVVDSAVHYTIDKELLTNLVSKSATRAKSRTAGRNADGKPRVHDEVANDDFLREAMAIALDYSEIAP